MSELLTDAQAATSNHNDYNESQSAPIESLNTEVQHEPAASGETNHDNDSFVARSLDEDDSRENNNAENARRRIEGKYRKKDREIEELKAQIQYLSQAISSSGNVGVQNNNYQTSLDNNPYGNVVIDPITGEHLTPGTPRYEVVSFHQQQNILHKKQMEFEKRQRDAQVLNELNERYEELLDETASKYPDYYDVVKGKFSQEAIAATMYIDKGPELLYYIGKNPKEVQRISKLHPILQQQAIAKHALEFAARNKVSSAPAPVAPIGETSKAPQVNSFNKLARDPVELRKYFKEKRRSNR